MVPVTPGFRHSPSPSLARWRGPPELGSISPPNKNGHQKHLSGLGTGAEHSSGTPPWPLDHLVQGADPRAKPGPGEQAGLARQTGEGWEGRSLWHLQGRHLRLHLEILVESDHCIPARTQEGKRGEKGSQVSPVGGIHTVKKISHQLSPSRSGQMDPSPGWVFLFILF